MKSKCPLKEIREPRLVVNVDDNEDDDLINLDNLVDIDQKVSMNDKPYVGSV